LEYPDGTFSLQTRDGHFLVAEGGGGGALNATRRASGPWERFAVSREVGGTFALRTDNGHFVVAEGGGGGAVNANRRATGPWERFTIVVHDGPPLVPATEGLLISEVMFRPHPGEAPWVELVNLGAEGHTGGWDLRGLDGAARVALPAVILPPGGRLVVELGVGTDDLDGRDGVATVYVGPAIAMDPVIDGLGLYRGGEVTDFIAWSHPEDGFPPLGGTGAYDAALAAGIWSPGDFVPTLRIRGETGRPTAVRPGQSVSRGPDEEDTDSGADLELHWDGSKWGADAPTVAQIVLHDGDAQVTRSAWTTLVYVAADNNLEDAANRLLDTTERMLAVGRGTSRVVVLLDSGRQAVAFDPVRDVSEAGSLGHAFRGELRGDRTTGRVHLYAGPGERAAQNNLGELSTGSGQTLEDFVRWGRARFPAENYALVVWGHGDQWKGIASDDDADDVIQIGELGTHLDRALDGDRFGLVYLSACLTGAIEYAYQLRDLADVMVGSPAVLSTWDEEVALLHAAFQRGQTSEEAAQRLLGSFQMEHAIFDRLADSSAGQWTLTAVRLGAKTQLMGDRIDALGVALGARETTRNATEYGGLDDHGDGYRAPDGDARDNQQTALGEAMQGAQHYQRSCCTSGADYVDLGDLATRAGADARFPHATREAFRRIRRAVDQAVVLAVKGGVFAKGTGLSIYFPSAQGDAFEAPEKPRAKNEDTFDEPASGAFARGLAAGSPSVKYGPDLDPFRCGREDPDQPRPNAPLFDLADLTSWPQVLHRFYEPVADAACTPARVGVGETVTCRGTGSSIWAAEPKRVLDYSWDLDAAWESGREIDADCRPESDDEADRYGEVTRFHFRRPGRFRVTLTVGAGQHEKDQDSAVVEVVGVDGVTYPEDGPGFDPVRVEPDFETPPYIGGGCGFGEPERCEMPKPQHRQDSEYDD